VGTLLASGQVALGFQQLSELLGIDGIDIIGILPEAIRIDTVFCAALTACAKQVDATRRFFAFLNAPGLADAKQANGMSPV
jgi:molybdate transport system substrate-binding protein